MKETISVGVIGYGNIGRGVAYAVAQNPDMKLIGIFTRRDPSTVVSRHADSRVYKVSEVEKFSDDIDVVILCGGSATDLPEQGPRFARLFNTVDSYDTHAKIPEYFDAVNSAAQEAGTVSVISTGWDPGLFSLMRVVEEAVLPEGESYTFWGPGVSQGHSDAIRRIEGVKDARQYTIPVERAVDAVRTGSRPDLSTREKHRRDCYVVAEEGADEGRIKEEILTMPHYFSDYDTGVTFISPEEMKAKHSAMPHGGFVMRTGVAGEHHTHVVEFALKLENNPAFTASVLVAYARAAWRMSREGQSGAKTVFDIAPAYLSRKPAEELRRTML